MCLGVNAYQCLEYLVRLQPMRVADYARLVALDDGVVRSQFSNLERIGLLRRFVREGKPLYELTNAGLDELAQIRDDIAMAQGVEI